MDKTYYPKNIESSYQKLWQKLTLFSPNIDINNQDKSYCIMLPPPNITGHLHMGHAFQHTIMDILSRYHRSCGLQTLWQPGTDHAGIATQMVVEKQLLAQNINRLDLSREEFIDKIWQWKNTSGNTIAEQMKKLGTSVDWSRERFTMDEGLSDAVQEVFIQLYQEGLIYRGERLVNWDPVLQTALSDLEVIAKEEAGFIHHVRYPFVDGDGFMEIATTRPETILADGALAVNPADERYKDLVGQWVWVPMTDRKIPIITDNYVTMDFGTGCVKITPAHDFNDWEVGKRHKMEVIQLFTVDAKMNKNAPQAYWGLDRFVARKRILKDLDAAGLLIKVEAHKLTPPRGDRSGAILEPFLTKQWFVKTKTLAEPAIEAVKNGDINFIPKNWNKTYFNWMNRIEDWCISRQIIWGHRIPAWYDEKGNIFVAKTQQAAEKQAAEKLGQKVSLTQDDDVLDTWFSSALWPFSTLGWPKQTPELKTFYPTSVLVTGFDIIFFWVARMIMFGLKFTKKVPFKDIYITGLIRDHHGQKMSKSKGNVLDPIDCINGISLDNLLKKRTQGMMQPQMKGKIIQATKEAYPDGIPALGTDALRFTFATLASFGHDISFDLKRVEGYRNFCNKLWNAARFVLSNLEKNTKYEDYQATLMSNLWIQAQLNKNIQTTHQHLKTYRIDLMAQNLYDFVWHDYCDWYLELSKPLLKDKTTCLETQQTLLFVLLDIVKILHPIIPFISEDIYQHLKPFLKQTHPSLTQEAFPTPQAKEVNPEIETQIYWVKTFILGIRQIRSTMNIAPSKALPCLLSHYNATDEQYLNQHRQTLISLSRLNKIELLAADTPEPESAIALVDTLKILIPLSGFIDKTQEQQRLSKGINKLQKQQQIFEKKLTNQKFLDNAPDDIIKKNQEKLNKINQTLDNMKEQLKK